MGVHLSIHPNTPGKKKSRVHTNTDGDCFYYEEIGYVYLAFKLAWQNSELEILFFPRARGCTSRYTLAPQNKKRKTNTAHLVTPLESLLIFFSSDSFFHRSMKVQILVCAAALAAVTGEHLPWHVCKMTHTVSSSCVRMRRWVEGGRGWLLRGPVQGRGRARFET